MFNVIVELNNKKIRIIFPHKCGSSTFRNLIQNGYFDVPLIAENRKKIPADEIHVYGRNPYRKTISSFFQMKFTSDSNIDYIERTSDEKVDEFRNFIRKTKKVWEEHGLIPNATEDLPTDLEIYYNHVIPTCVDMLVELGHPVKEFDHMKINTFEKYCLQKMEEMKDKVIFHHLEDVLNNFVLKDYWKESSDFFKPFESFDDYLDKYKSMKHDTHTERYQHHVYYNSTNVIRNSPYHIFYDEETLMSVNSMFDMDFKYFNYPKCKSIYDIKKFTEEEE